MKLGWNESALSRRKLLKCLGIGAGAIAINIFAGCTQLSNSVLVGDFKIDPQAKADLTTNTLKACRKVLRAYYNLDQISTDELKQRVGHAKEVTLEMINDWDISGHSAQIDRILNTAPDRYEHLKEVKQHYLKEFKDAMTEKHLTKLEELLNTSGTKDSANHILKEGGVSALIRKHLSSASSQPAMNDRLIAAIDDPIFHQDWYNNGGGCWTAGWVCLAALAASAAACSAYPNSNICENAIYAAGGVCAGAGILCLVE